MAAKRKVSARKTHGQSPIGRPSKILEGWTAERGEWDDHSPAGKILVAVRGGNYREIAAKWANVDRTTLFKWLERGSEHATDLHISRDDLPYVQFRNALDRAETSYEIEAVLRATRAAETPESILRLLGRRHPERWGANREQLNVNLQGQVETGIVPGAIARAVLETARKREAALELLNLVADDGAEPPAAPQAQEAEAHDVEAIVNGEHASTADPAAPAAPDEGEAEDDDRSE